MLTVVLEMVNTDGVVMATGAVATSCNQDNGVLVKHWNSNRYFLSSVTYEMLSFVTGVFKSAL